MMQKRPRLAALCWVLILAAVCQAGPINREAGPANDLHLDKRNGTYDGELSVCVIDDVLYRAGDVVPAGTSCERCVCQPPGFNCAPVVCDMKPGCKALQNANQCCPEYQCECEKNGRVYQNGEKLEDPDSPCSVCYCQGGEIVCTTLECYLRNDCEPQFMPGRCCPKYDHCPPIETQRTHRPQYTRSTFQPTSEGNQTGATQKAEYDQDIGASSIHLTSGQATAPDSSTASAPADTREDQISGASDTRLLGEQDDKAPPFTSDSSLVGSTLPVLSEEKPFSTDREDEISTSITRTDEAAVPSTESSSEDENSSSSDSAQSVPVEEKKQSVLVRNDAGITQQLDEQADETPVSSIDSATEDDGSSSADSTESVHTTEKSIIPTRDEVSNTQQLNEHAASSTDSSYEDDSSSDDSRQSAQTEEKPSAFNRDYDQATDAPNTQLLSEQTVETFVHSTQTTADDESDSVVGSTQSAIAEQEKTTLNPQRNQEFIQKQAHESPVVSTDTSVEEESSSFVGSTTLDVAEEKTIGASSIALQDERTSGTTATATEIASQDDTPSYAADQDIGASNTQKSIHLLGEKTEEIAVSFTELALADEDISTYGTTTASPVDINTSKSDSAETENYSTNSEKQQIDDQTKKALLEEQINEEVTTANYVFTTEAGITDTPAVEQRSGLESGSGEFPVTDSSEEGSGSTTSHDSDETNVSSAPSDSSTNSQTHDKSGSSEDHSDEGSGIEEVEPSTEGITLATLIYGNTNIHDKPSGALLNENSETATELNGSPTLDYTNDSSSELSSVAEEFRTAFGTDTTPKYQESIDEKNDITTTTAESNSEAYDTTEMNDENTAIYKEQQTLTTTPAYGIIERANLQIDASISTPSVQTSTDSGGTEEAQAITIIDQFQSATEITKEISSESDEELNDKSNGLKVTGDFLTETFTETSSASNETPSDSESAVSNESSSDVSGYSSLEYKHDLVEGVRVTSVYPRDAAAENSSGDVTGLNRNNNENGSRVDSESVTEVNKTGHENYEDKSNLLSTNTATESDQSPTQTFNYGTSVSNETEISSLPEVSQNSDNNALVTTESYRNTTPRSLEDDVQTSVVELEATVEPETENIASIVQPIDAYSTESKTHDLTSLPSISNEENNNEGATETTTVTDESEESTTMNTVTNRTPVISNEESSAKEFVKVEPKDNFGEDKHGELYLNPVALHDADDEPPVLMIGDELANHQMDVVMATSEMLLTTVQESDSKDEQNNSHEFGDKVSTNIDVTTGGPTSAIDTEGTTYIPSTANVNNENVDLVTDSKHIIMNDSPALREEITDANGSEELNEKLSSENDTGKSKTQPMMNDDALTTETSSPPTTLISQEDIPSTHAPKEDEESRKKLTAEITNFQESTRIQHNQEEKQTNDKEIQETLKMTTSSSGDLASVQCIRNEQQTECSNKVEEVELQGHSFELSSSDHSTTEDSSSNTEGTDRDGLLNDELLLTQTSSEVDDSTTEHLAQDKKITGHTIGVESILDITTAESSSSEDSTTEIHIHGNQYQKESTTHSELERTSSESLSSEDSVTEPAKTGEVKVRSGNEELLNDGPVLEQTSSETSSYKDTPTPNSDQDEITSSTEIAESAVTQEFPAGSINTTAEEKSSSHSADENKTSSEVLVTGPENDTTDSGEINQSEIDSIIKKMFENSSEILLLTKGDSSETRVNGEETDKNMEKIIAEVVPLKLNSTDYTDSGTLSPDWLKSENETSDSSLVENVQEDSDNKLGSSWNNNTDEELQEPITMPQDWLKVGNGPTSAENEQTDHSVTADDLQVTTVVSLSTEDNDLGSTTVTDVETLSHIEENNSSTAVKTLSGAYSSSSDVETTHTVQEIEPLEAVTTSSDVDDSSYDTESNTELTTEAAEDTDSPAKHHTSSGVGSITQLTTESIVEKDILTEPKLEDSNNTAQTTSEEQPKGGSSGLAAQAVDGDAVDRKDLYILQDFFKKLYRHENSEETTVL